MPDILEYNIPNKSILSSLQALQATCFEVCDLALEEVKEIIINKEPILKAILSSSYLTDKQVRRKLYRDANAVATYFSPLKSQLSINESITLFLSQGRIFQSLQACKTLTAKYQSHLRSSNFNEQFTINALKDVEYLLQIFNKQTINFSPICDETIYFMCTTLPRLTDTTTFFSKSKQSNLTNLTDITRKYLHAYHSFLKHFKSQLIEATIYCVDSQARQLGLSTKVDDFSSFEQLQNVLNFHSQLQDTLHGLKEFITGSDIVEKYHNQIKLFEIIQSNHNSIDEIVGAKRIDYIWQSIDPGLFFNPGLCFGGSRYLALTNDPDKDEIIFSTAAVTAETKKSNFSTYQQLNTMKTSPDLFKMQYDQENFAQRNNTHISMLLDRVEPKTSLQTPSGDLDINAFKDYLAKALTTFESLNYVSLKRGYHGPRVSLIFNFGNNTAHVISLRAYLKSDKASKLEPQSSSPTIFYRFRDLNSGTFEFDTLEGFLEWLVEYCQALQYCNLSDYQFEITYPKSAYSPQAFYEGIAELLLKKENLVGSSEITVGYQQFKDKQLREQITALRQQIALGREVIANIQRSIELYDGLSQPTLHDNMSAIYNITHIIDIYETNDLQIALEYTYKALTILEKVDFTTSEFFVKQCYYILLIASLCINLEKQSPGTNLDVADNLVKNITDNIPELVEKYAEHIEQMYQGIHNKDPIMVELAIENITNSIMEKLCQNLIEQAELANGDNDYIERIRDMFVYTEYSSHLANNELDLDAEQRLVPIRSIKPVRSHFTLSTTPFMQPMLYHQITSPCWYYGPKLAITDAPVLEEEKCKTVNKDHARNSFNI